MVECIVETNDDAELSQDDIESQIAVYERQFGMTSNEFMQRMRDANFPDTFETMAWTILLRYTPLTLQTIKEKVLG